jgi:uncharacterized protein with von Willebrand factor type A (vWA) domain
MRAALPPRRKRCTMARAKSTSKPAEAPERRKLIAFDEETFRALDLLARDSMSTVQELADEAFRDLLKKHGRPTDLRTALRKSAADAGSPPKPVRQRKRS